MATDVKLTIGNYSFDPVPPQISLTNQSNKTNSRKPISNSSTGTLNGTIVNNGKAAANIEGLLSLKKEMEDALLDCETCQFMSLLCDNTVFFSQFVRVVSIEFQPSPDNWVFTIPYTINIEWEPSDSSPCNKCLKSITDNIDISPIEQNSPFVIDTCPSGVSYGGDPSQWYQVTRSLSAIGVECCPDPSGYNASIDISGNVNITGPSGANDIIPGWQVARDWVLSQADCIPVIDCSGVFAQTNPSGFSFYNRSRVKSYSCSEGTFNLTDTWMASDSDNPIDVQENFNVDVQTSNSECVTTYSITGTINGMETRDCDNTLSKTKYEAAKTYFDSIQGDIVNRINCLCEPTCSINTAAISSSVSRSPGSGTITYNYSYTDRPQLLPGSLNESLTISDTLPSRIINEARLLGRAQPLLQNCGAVTSRTKNVQFSATLPRDCAPMACAEFLTSYLNFSGLNDLLCCVETQLETVYDEVYKTADQIDWDPYTCVYSRAVSWVYQDCDEVINPSGLC